MGLEWDPKKAESNYRKHGVRFSETEPAFEDDLALTIPDADSDPEEVRFVSIGMGAMARVLVVVYAYRESNIRIISARLAAPHERAAYEEAR
ncbi:MAG TPA: BrnT family toxin [Terracidiphilus sp.]|nr:BrnT family toxin [Terracidiphilus sp.]